MSFVGWRGVRRQAKPATVWTDTKLSPTIVYSVFLGTLALVKIPKTAIGSVGDINAPKIRQYIKLMSKLKI